MRIFFALSSFLFINFSYSKVFIEPYIGWQSGTFEQDVKVDGTITTPIGMIDPSLSNSYTDVCGIANDTAFGAKLGLKGRRFYIGTDVSRLFGSKIEFLNDCQSDSIDTSLDMDGSRFSVSFFIGADFPGWPNFWIGYSPFDHFKIIDGSSESTFKGGGLRIGMSFELFWNLHANMELRFNRYTGRDDHNFTATYQHESATITEYALKNNSVMFFLSLPINFKNNGTDQVQSSY